MRLVERSVWALVGAILVGALGFLIARAFFADELSAIVAVAAVAGAALGAWVGPAILGFGGAFA